MGARGGNAISAREATKGSVQGRPPGEAQRDGFSERKTKQREHYDDAGQLEQWRRFMRKREPTNPERARDGRKRQAYKTARTGAKRRARDGRNIISLSGKSGPGNGRRLERTSGKQGKMRVQRHRKGGRHDGRKALEPAGQALGAAEDVGQTSCKRRRLYDKMIS